MLGRRVGIRPDRERCLQVRAVDMVGPVEQGIDQGEPDALRLGPGGDAAM